jgi:hypothetical protein
MQKGRWFLCVNEECSQLRLAGFQPIHFLLHGWMVHAVCDGIDGCPDLLFDAAEFGPGRIDRRPAFHAKPVHFPSELVAELFEQCRVHQVKAQRVEHALLQPIPANVRPIVAGALVPGRGAADELSGDHGIAAPATGAFGETGEQIFWAPAFTEVVFTFTAVVATLDLDRRLPSLGSVPENVIQNS